MDTERLRIAAAGVTNTDWLSATFDEKRLALVLTYAGTNSDENKIALEKLVDVGILSRRKESNYSVAGAGFNVDPKLNRRGVQLYWTSESFAKRFLGQFPQARVLRVVQNGEYVLPEQLKKQDWLEVRIKMGGYYDADLIKKNDIFKQILDREIVAKRKSRKGKPRQRGTFSVVYQQGTSTKGRSYLDIADRPFLSIKDAECYARSFPEKHQSNIHVVEN